MNGRLWYPQLDVYSCIRRMGSLLLEYESAPSIERLYITDFFFANPPLLHKCKMSRATRRNFYQLDIARPGKSFLRYPAAPLLFNKMEPIQKEALRAMTGKGILSMELLQTGLVELSTLGTELFETQLFRQCSDDEVSLIKFLAGDFSMATDDSIQALRKSSGIRRFR